jgi:hypothetical protein
MNIDPLIKVGRRLAGGALLDVGSIYDHVVVSDGRGGNTETWVLRRGTIPCRVVGVKDQLAENISDVLQGPGTAVILCEFGTVMHDQDRIMIRNTLYQIGARISADSTTTVVERYIGREV